MDKRISQGLLVLGCLVLWSSLLCGCGRQAGSQAGQNTPLGSLVQEFSRKGPEKQLQEWDRQIMQPALAVEAKLDQAKEAEVTAALQQVRQGQKVLQQVEPVKLTDAYVHFGKSYLAKLERVLQGKQQGQLEHEALLGLEDARLAFVNVQSELFKGQGTYRLKELKEGELQLGISYEQLHQRLAMPAAVLGKLEVQGVVHQPTLWAYGDRFLYVDFVDNKAVLIKLHTNPYLGKKEKKLKRQIAELEAVIMQPAVKLYAEYVKIAGQGKQSSTGAWLQAKLPKLKAYEQQLAAVPEDNPESAAYVKYAKAYLALMVERLEVAAGLPALAKEQQEESVKREALLEGRLVPEAGFVYANARGWLLQKQGTFCFPEYMVKELPKRPWQMSIEHWTQMPGVLVQSWSEQDKEKAWKVHRREIYVWALGEEYLLGEFVDEHLQHWKLQRLNDGFWYGR